MGTPNQKVTQKCGRCGDSFEYFLRKLGQTRLHCDECRGYTVEQWRAKITHDRCGNACLICGETRILERAHFIPKRFCENIVNMEELDSYDGINIVLLCPTHHKLFDRYKMNAEEKQKLIDFFGENAGRFIDHFMTIEPKDEQGNPSRPEHPLWKKRDQIHRDLAHWMVNQGFMWKLGKGIWLL